LKTALYILVALWATAALAAPLGAQDAPQANQQDSPGQDDSAAAAPAATTAPAGDSKSVADIELPQLESRDEAAGAIKWIGLVTVMSLAPALLMMVTSFTRIAVVLGLLRQALGTPQLPPNSVLMGLSVLMSVVVMSPILADIHADALAPYFDGRIEQSEAIALAEGHVRGFMIRQLQAQDNTDEVYTFLDATLAERAATSGLEWRDVPTMSLIPAFVISELKTAFIIGFRIFLPFVIIDMLVSSVLVSMGMLMLPPMLVSLPLKLLMFILADGWHLVSGTLIGSFG
jgi:flagellar biosynthetic protein FliP